jgi:hypothetical protein
MLIPIKPRVHVNRTTRRSSASYTSDPFDDFEAFAAGASGWRGAGTRAGGHYTRTGSANFDNFERYRYREPVRDLF